VVDISLHEAKFEGMKLSGIILVSCGFIMVLFPENWPDFIHFIIRLNSFHKSKLKSFVLEKNYFDYRMFRRNPNFEQEADLKTSSDLITGIFIS